MTRKSPRWVKINFKTETRISKGEPFGHTATLPVNCNKLNSVCTPRIARFVIGTSIVWQIRGGGVSDNRISYLVRFFNDDSSDESRQLPRGSGFSLQMLQVLLLALAHAMYRPHPTPPTVWKAVQCLLNKTNAQVYDCILGKRVGTQNNWTAA